MVDCKECKNYNICEIRKMVEGKLKRCQSFEQKKPQTNADRIRSMSDEELAEFLVDHHRYPCKYCVHCWKDSENDVGCKGALMRWLKSEAKE